MVTRWALSTRRPPFLISFPAWPPTHQLLRTRWCRAGPGDVQGVGLTHTVWKWALGTDLRKEPWGL